ncbi:MAG: orotate phosphoribosyltransferase [Bacteroidetes bacterium]|nr:orotate phosphoribosyltransferase [Bacteroidota bacterium]
MLPDQKTVAEKLLAAGAVKLSPDAPFTWASGWKSPIYCDNRKLLSLPYTRDFIKSELCNLIFEKFNDAAVLAGVATAGIAWSAMTADQLKLPLVYVRPKPKEHGLGNQIEGMLQEGQDVVVIEDLISTGKSSLLVVDVLRKAGVNILGMVSIFNYGFYEADIAFREKEVPIFSLSNYETMIELAIEKGIVHPEQEAVLKDWRKNPAGWG